MTKKQTHTQKKADMPGSHKIMVLLFSVEVWLRISGSESRLPRSRGTSSSPRISHTCSPVIWSSCSRVKVMEIVKMHSTGWLWLTQPGVPQFPVGGEDRQSEVSLRTVSGIWAGTWIHLLKKAVIVSPYCCYCPLRWLWGQRKSSSPV